MEPKLWIPPATFETVVENTPLVSIDFVVTKQGTLLVGERVNRPAKGTYFVPGGRICKNEKLDDAFRRIAHDEIGLDVMRKNSDFMGIYDHIYPDSTLNPDSSTHYVVLAFHMPLRGMAVDEEKMRTQHKGFKFMSYKDIIENDSVHENTKVYARILKGVYPHKRE